MDMYPLLVRCVGVINEMSGIVGDRFGAVCRCTNLTATASGFADFFVEVIAFACLLQTPRYGINSTIIGENTGRR